MGKPWGFFSTVQRRSEPCCEVMLGRLCPVLVETSSNFKGTGWYYEKKELRTNQGDFSQVPSRSMTH